MTLKRVRELIRDVPDFPKPGIVFKDITPLLADPGTFQFATSELARRAEEFQAEAIVGIESRGFLFGAPVALSLGLPFVPVRKPGKLPFRRMSMEYALEYGNSQLDIHEDALKSRQRVVIIDDLLATGGTAHAAAKLAELAGGMIAGLLFVIELTQLNGRSSLSEYPVQSLLTY